jgi:sulfotransferase family protein
MKVIGAGFGRTGTLSTKAALEKLGFGPCYHMFELMSRPEHLTAWDAATDRVARGETADWEKIFSGYEATVDWPGCVYYEELMEAYPDAKVLLNVRDPERWYNSVQDSFLRQMGSPSPVRSAMMFKVLPAVLPSMRRMASVSDKMMERTFGVSRFEDMWDKANAIEVFEKHIERVREHVPNEKLLVYDVKQGWEPLCAFLGVEVPDEPFPYLNDREQFPKVMRRQMASAVAPVLGRAVVAVSALLFIVWALRWAARVPRPI